MNTPKLIAIFLAVFAITSHAETVAQLVTRITDYGLTAVANASGDTVTVTGTKTGATNSTWLDIDDGVSVIWKASLTANTTSSLIYLNGTGSFEVQSGGTIENTAVSNYAMAINGSNFTGKITVSSNAKVASAATSSAYATIYTENAETTDEWLVITGGTVENTATGNAVSSYSDSRAVTISGGTVSATTGVAVAASNGAVTISGGTVSATTGNAVGSSINGAVTISGGTVSATTGNAVYSSGKITVSGNAKVTSENITSTRGTIYNSGGSLEIIGGTVENTAANTNARAILNGFGTVTISGGTVIAKDGYAVYRDNQGTVTLTGGAVFAYGTTANDVISGTTVDGNPAIVAWNKSAGSTTYTALDNAHIFSATPTTATWNGRGGIAYANGANTGFIPIEGVMVNKLTGLENNAPPHFSISAATTAEHTYSLHTIALNKDDHGELSYSLGTFTNDDNILAAKPTLNGTTLTYKGTGKPSGEATLEIIIESDNYEPITATLTFEATPKPEVTITGITAQNFVYDGTPKKGYSGTATSGAYTGALVYEYAGPNYPQTATPPTNIGEYTLRITLPPEAPYTGEWRGTFSITTGTPILPQIASGSIRVQTTANAIMLENLPRNTKIQVYSLQGKQIHSTNSGNSKILRIMVQTKGVYVVKVGNQTLRIAVK
jgi:hypothetical protein